MSSAAALRTALPDYPARAAPSVAIFTAGVPKQTVYRQSQRVNPLALIGSLAMVAAITGSIAMVNGVVPVRKARSLAVFTMDLTPPPPPPPAAEQAPTDPVAPAELLPTPPEPVTPPAPVPVVQTMPTLSAAPAAVASAAVPVAPAVAAPASNGAAAAPAPQSAAPVDGGDLSAKMIAAPAPTYPIECRRRHEQGIVKLLVLVGRDGRVENVSVAGSSGSFRLDRAALGAVRQWRWSPVRRDGAEVMVRGFVTIPFVLKA